MMKLPIQHFGKYLRSIEKNLPGFPVVEHCNMAGHSINNALFHGIMLSRENTRRKHLEMRLTVQLGTSHLHGLNSNLRFLQATHTTNFIEYLLFSFMACANLARTNVLLTLLLKGQARNIWKETPTTTQHFCSSLPPRVSIGYQRSENSLLTMQNSLANFQ